MWSGCGRLVKPTGRLDARNFQGLRLARCCFWLRIGVVVGSLKILLQVKGGWNNPSLLVLGANLKAMMKVWGAFQNPMCSDYNCMSIYCTLVSLKVMGVWNHPWYQLKVKGALVKPLCM